ncbi:MAG: hypothetical protein HYR73_01880 [Candidatus Eisenbacteria bacterium]|nr:hypothetical protein [Candidatus Eisenbacteria bacterium]
MKRLHALAVAAGFAFALTGTVTPPRALAMPPPYVGAQYRYWVFSNHNDLRDVLAYWVPGPFHVTLETWDYVDPASRDQFRPEVGVHLRDRRKSVYTVQWRHELDAERLTFGTEQILGGPWVGRAEFSPIIGKDSTQPVVSAGADYYWGSYNFASATLIHDPRGSDLWSIPLRVRAANESNDWVQITVVPTTHRSLGWAFDARIKGVRAGIERNSRYDFTDLDNVVFTVGYEHTLGPGR